MSNSSLLLSLLTLTSFPFRVLYVNDAFSRAYGSSKVVGETFFDVFSQEGRQHNHIHHFAPNIVSCPTLLGIYRNEVVRLLTSSNNGVRVSCTIKVHPVLCKTRRPDDDQTGLSYYAVTVQSVPAAKTDVIVKPNDGDIAISKQSIPASIIFFPRTPSASSSISIKRRGQGRNFCVRDEPSTDEQYHSSSNTLFYLS